MFFVFAQFWLVSFFLHHAELWTSWTLTLISIVMLLIQFYSTNKVLSFKILLVPMIGYYFYNLPFLANHSNLVFLISFFLLIFLRKANSDDIESKFNNLRPVLCLSLAFVYILAAFHKFNYDFFNPEVSCAVETLYWYSYGYGFEEFNFPEWIKFALPVLTIVIELIGGVFLLIPIYRYLGLAMLTCMHLYLNPISIYDFSSVCMALMLCFFPQKLYLENKNEFKKMTKIYIIFVLVGGLGVLIESIFNFMPAIEPQKVLSWPFTLVHVYIVYKFITLLRKKYYKNELKTFKIRYMWLPGFILIFGFINYFGLRTAGNFTMFSNLRTEAGHSNHLFMPTSLQVFDYQKKLIYIINLDKKYIDHIIIPTGGLYITEFEFKRYVNKWKRKGLTVPIVIEHNNKVYEYKDVTKVEKWLTNSPSWLSQKLQIFRPVQKKNEPNFCRW